MQSLTCNSFCFATRANLNKIDSKNKIIDKHKVILKMLSMFLINAIIEIKLTLLKLFKPDGV